MSSPEFLMGIEPVAKATQVPANARGWRETFRGLIYRKGGLCANLKGEFEAFLDRNCHGWVSCANFGWRAFSKGGRIRGWDRLIEIFSEDERLTSFFAGKTPEEQEKTAQDLLATLLEGGFSELEILPADDDDWEYRYLEHAGYYDDEVVQV